jgi:hypothetical protein
VARQRADFLLRPNQRLPDSGARTDMAVRRGAGVRRRPSKTSRAISIMRHGQQSPSAPSRHNHHA